MKPFTPRSEWKGKSTYSPDCSDKNESPWGFDTFERGTVGNAILGWIINGWNEICPDETEPFETLVLREFNCYINDIDIATALRDAFFRDYQPLLRMTMNWMSGEDDIMEWLRNEMRPFCQQEEVNVGS
jgi:hypothetical protein